MSKIFVGGLNYDTDRATLTEAFSTCGKILQVLILREPESGRSRGFCFIKFSSTREANIAIEKMNGVEIDGKILRVDYCSDNKQTNNRNFPQDNRQDSSNFFESSNQARGNYGISSNRDNASQSSGRSNGRYSDTAQDRLPQNTFGVDNQRNNSGSHSNFKSNYGNDSSESDNSRINIKSEYDNIFGEIPNSQKESSRSGNNSNYGGNYNSSGFQNNNGSSNAPKSSYNSNFDNSSRGSRNEYNSNSGSYQSKPNDFYQDQNKDNRNTNYSRDRFENSSRYQDKPFNNNEQGQNYSKRDNSYGGRDSKTQESQDGWFSIAPPANQNTNKTHGGATSNWD